ncbi:MAG: hypothetical protein Q7U82_07230 [Gammaproteobacteria bacterium]|nr:hypothetical protein [Gammaproteobacteria bacterium]
MNALANALRAVAAGDEHQSLITDIFERITFYDLRIESALARIVDDGYAGLIFIRENIGGYLAAKSWR